MIKTTEETRENNKTQQLIEILNGTNVYDEFSQTIIDYAKSLNRFSYFKGTKELNVFVNVDGILSLNRIVNRSIGFFKIRPTRMSSEVYENIKNEDVDYLSNYFKRSIKRKAIDVVSNHSRLVIEKSIVGFENVRLRNGEFILLSEIMDSQAHYKEKTYIVEQLFLMHKFGILTDDSFNKEESGVILGFFEKMDIKLNEYLELYLYTKMKLNPEKFNSVLLYQIRKSFNYNHKINTMGDAYYLLDEIAHFLKIIKEFSENLSNVQLNFKELEDTILSELRIITEKVKDSVFKRIDNRVPSAYIIGDIAKFVYYINKINFFMNTELNLFSSYDTTIGGRYGSNLFDIMKIESEATDSNVNNYVFNINSEINEWERCLYETDSFLTKDLDFTSEQYESEYEHKLLELKEEIKSHNIKIHKPIFDSLSSYIKNKIDCYSLAGLDNNYYYRYMKILNIIEVENMDFSDASITKQLFSLTYNVGSEHNVFKGSEHNVFKIITSNVNQVYNQFRNLNSIVVPELYKIALI